MPGAVVPVARGTGAFSSGEEKGIEVLCFVLSGKRHDFDCLND